MTGKATVSELVCQRVVLSASWLSASWFVSELSCQRVGLSASCVVSELTVSELTCQPVGLSASCLVSELTVSELVCQRVVLSASWLSVSWFVSELSVKRFGCLVLFASLFLFAHCTAHHWLCDPSTTGSESSVYCSWVVTRKKKMMMMTSAHLKFQRESLYNVQTPQAPNSRRS